LPLFLAEDLEYKNSVNIERSYGKIYRKPALRVPVNRSINAPLDAPMTLSVNTRSHIGASKERNENIDNYLGEFPRIDEIYRKKLEDIKTGEHILSRNPLECTELLKEIKTFTLLAHLRKPVVDGRIQEALENKEESKAWFWGQQRSDSTEIDDETDEFDAQAEFGDGSFYWGDKLADRDADDYFDVKDNFVIQGESDPKIEEHLYIGESKYRIPSEEQASSSSSEVYAPERPLSSSAKNGPVLIMQLYHKCCETMAKVAGESILDYRRDYLYSFGAFSYLKNLISQVANF